MRILMVDNSETSFIQHRVGPRLCIRCNVNIAPQIAWFSRTYQPIQKDFERSQMLAGLSAKRDLPGEIKNFDLSDLYL